MIAHDLLIIPPDEDDMNDQREQLENVMIVQRQLIERFLHQYQQETWISSYLRAGLEGMERAHELVITIINNGNLPQADPERPKPM
jgi:hypothetical protein